MGLAVVAPANAFATDLVKRIAAAVIGEKDYSALHFTIHQSVFMYGHFMSALIIFVSIAAAVFFFIVKPVDVAMKRIKNPAEEAAPPSGIARRPARPESPAVAASPRRRYRNRKTMRPRARS